MTYYLSPILTSAGVTDPGIQSIINVCMVSHIRTAWSSLRIATTRVHVLTLQNIWNYPWAIAGALLANRLGRRTLFFISTGGMLVCYIIITALAAEYNKTGIPATGYALIAFLFFFFGERGSFAATQRPC